MKQNSEEIPFTSSELHRMESGQFSLFYHQLLRIHLFSVINFHKINSG
jgi:hypothetical protein